MEKNWAKAGLILSLILFVITKWPALHLPYFWDEAWSYMPAIAEMARKGICFSPGCIDVELYRGHPLFFYAISAGWMKYISASSFSMHFFALLISLLTVISFYRVLLLVMLPRWALLAVILLLTQEVFYVQATFVLPEVFIVLLTFELIRSYILDQKFYFIFLGFLLAITKEIGLVILVCVLIVDLLSKKNKTKKDLLIYASLLPAIIFFVFQKIKFGWFFYPLHTDLISFSIESIKSKIVIISNFILIERDRAILVIMLGVFLIPNLKKDKKFYFLTAGLIMLVSVFYFIGIGRVYDILALLLIIVISISGGHYFSVREKKLLLLGVSLFAVVFLFSMVNFLMIRYLLLLVPIFIFFIILCLKRILNGKLLWYGLFVSIGMLMNVYSMVRNYENKQWHDDVSMNYLNAVKAHQDVVRYCTDQDWQDENILTHFLLYTDLTVPEAGYLGAQWPFRQVRYNGGIRPEDKIIIFSCIEYDESLHNHVKNNAKYQLQKRFTAYNAWAEIYIRSEPKEILKIEY